VTDEDYNDADDDSANDLVNAADDIDDAHDINVADDMAGNRVEGGTARAVLDYITRSIASDPDAVVLEADDSGRTIRFRIRVAQRDMGRMIGRRGRVAQAIRTVVRVAGSRDGVETNVDFVDD
jgi:uncharacterized protein